MENLARTARQAHTLCTMLNADIHDTHSLDFTHATKKNETHDTNSTVNCLNLHKQKTQKPKFVLLQLVCNQSVHSSKGNYTEKKAFK